MVTLPTWVANSLFCKSLESQLVNSDRNQTPSSITLSQSNLWINPKKKPWTPSLSLDTIWYMPYHPSWSFKSMPGLMAWHLLNSLTPSMPMSCQVYGKRAMDNIQDVYNPKNSAHEELRHFHCHHPAEGAQDALHSPFAPSNYRFLDFDIPDPARLQPQEPKALGKRKHPEDDKGMHRLPVRTSFSLAQGKEAPHSTPTTSTY